MFRRLNTSHLTTRWVSTKPQLIVFRPMSGALSTWILSAKEQKLISGLGHLIDISTRTPPEPVGGGKGKKAWMKILQRGQKGSLSSELLFPVI